MVCSEGPSEHVSSDGGGSGVGVGSCRLDVVAGLQRCCGDGLRDASEVPDSDVGGDRSGSAELEGHGMQDTPSAARLAAEIKSFP